MVSLRSAAKAAAFATMVLLAAGRAQAEDWAPLWTTASLSQRRDGLSATSAGGKVFFAGGFYSLGASDRVDIYDTATGQWSTANLSVGRYDLGAASAGGKVFFGGGMTTYYSDRVDIYDTATGQWSTANLSQARWALSATSAGAKVYFGGGGEGRYCNRVDIYDTATGQWSTASLSQARFWLSATSAGGKVFFAGGRYHDILSDRVDIYDTATAQWSTANLSQARTSPVATSAGGKVFFAGGSSSTGPSDRVDIYDTATAQWSSASLSQARTALAATSAGGKVFFGGGYAGNDTESDRVDIYDTVTGQWSIATLSWARNALSATSAGNKVFFAGGQSSGATSSVVDIYTLQNYGTITTTQNWTLVADTSVDGLMQLYDGSLKLGTYRLTVGSMSGSAPINLDSSTLTVGGDATLSIYSGAISGHGGLTKTGAGMLTLSATSSYDGTTRVSGGILNLTGSIAASPVVIDGGTLQGTGRVGTITGTSGYLHPGGSPGILPCGSVTMSPGFYFDLSLDGPAPGTGYSELDVTGLVNLGGATLNAALGYDPAWYSGQGPPDLLFIIKNDGVDGVIGQFSGLPPFSTLDLVYNGLARSAVISYAGDYDAGTLTGGNDVVIALPEPATLSLLALGGLALLRRRRAIWRCGVGLRGTT